MNVVLIDLLVVTILQFEAKRVCDPLKILLVIDKLPAELMLMIIRLVVGKLEAIWTDEARS